MHNKECPEGRVRINAFSCCMTRIALPRTLQIHPSHLCKLFFFFTKNVLSSHLPVTLMNILTSRPFLDGALIYTGPRNNCVKMK
uniref:Uncharacterized protein n=1 Tax=Arundo donax TaxID=35708 RepID=A0A0A9CBD0_ARUDO